MNGKKVDLQAVVIVKAVKTSGYFDSGGRFHMLRCIGRIYPTKTMHSATAVPRQAA